MTLSELVQPPRLISQLRRRAGIISGERISGQGTTTLDHAIPPVLRPLVRAYLLGYASTVAPRLLTLVLQQLTRRRKGRDAAATTSTKSSSSNGSVAKHDQEGPPQQPQTQQPQQPFLVAFKQILSSGLDWQRFPTFCAALAGGSTLLEVCTLNLMRCIM